MKNELIIKNLQEIKELDFADRFIQGDSISYEMYLRQLNSVLQEILIEELRKQYDFEISNNNKVVINGIKSYEIADIRSDFRRFDVKEIDLTFKRVTTLYAPDHVDSIKIKNSGIGGTAIPNCKLFLHDVNVIEIGTGCYGIKLYVNEYQSIKCYSNGKIFYSKKEDEYFDLKDREKRCDIEERYYDYPITPQPNKQDTINKINEILLMNDKIIDYLENNKN